MSQKPPKMEIFFEWLDSELHYPVNDLPPPNVYLEFTQLLIVFTGPCCLSVWQMVVGFDKTTQPLFCFTETPHSLLLGHVLWACDHPGIPLLNTF